MVNSETRDLIERGFAKAVLHRQGPLVAIVVVFSEEGVAAINAVNSGLPVLCRTCRAPYPVIGRIPKYSDCANCRSKHVSITLDHRL